MPKILYNIIISYKLFHAPHQISFRRLYGLCLGQIIDLSLRSSIVEIIRSSDHTLYTPHITMTQSNNNIILYHNVDGAVKLEVMVQDETVRLSQDQMATLFGKSIKTINEHIANIYKEGELIGKSTMKKMRLSGNSGFSTKPTNYYNLDVIISVGYRVKSQQGTQFRQRATQRIHEYIIKGFTMDDERLKQSGSRSRYFQELLQRVRDIRSSERNLYQKITDIYTTSSDYNPKDNMTQQFFATVQNKMHYAVHGNTAAELIYQRANSESDKMGLTNFKGDYITQYDIGIAKNYLTEKELQTLNLIVSMYLDFAELQALNQQTMTMKQWIEKLDEFLKISQKDILTHVGTISHTEALQKAREQFEKYKSQEMLGYNSDFDNFIQNTKSITKS